MSPALPPPPCLVWHVPRAVPVAQLVQDLGRHTTTHPLQGREGGAGGGGQVRGTHPLQGKGGGAGRGEAGKGGGHTATHSLQGRGAAGTGDGAGCHRRKNRGREEGRGRACVGDTGHVCEGHRGVREWKRSPSCRCTGRNGKTAQHSPPASIPSAQLPNYLPPHATVRPPNMLQPAPHPPNVLQPAQPTPNTLQPAQP